MVDQGTDLVHVGMEGAFVRLVKSLGNVQLAAVTGTLGNDFSAVLQILKVVELGINCSQESHEYLQAWLVSAVPDELRARGSCDLLCLRIG